MMCEEGVSIAEYDRTGSWIAPHMRRAIQAYHRPVSPAEMSKESLINKPTYQPDYIDEYPYYRESPAPLQSSTRKTHLSTVERRQERLIMESFRAPPPAPRLPTVALPAFTPELTYTQDSFSGLDLSDGGEHNKPVFSGCRF